MDSLVDSTHAPNRWAFADDRLALLRLFSRARVEQLFRKHDAGRRPGAAVDAARVADPNARLARGEQTHQSEAGGVSRRTHASGHGLEWLQRVAEARQQLAVELSRQADRHPGDERYRRRAAAAWQHSEAAWQELGSLQALGAPAGRVSGYVGA